MGRVWRRWCLLALSVAATLGVWVAPGLAHVEAQPGQAAAGTEAEVAFVVSHGCGRSPTTSLAIQLPQGVTGTPLPVEGFQAATGEGQVVRWSGGNLSADEQEAFRVRLLLPPTPGSTLHFPVIQSCRLGELRWMELPLTRQDLQQLDSPAALLRLTGPPMQAGPLHAEPPRAEARQRAGGQTGGNQSDAGQAGARDTPTEGPRPRGGVPAGAGGTAGPSWTGLLAAVGGAILGGALLFARLSRDV